MCQIMTRETARGPEYHFKRTRLFSVSSFLTETSGQMVYPSPRFRQPFSPLTLENFSILMPSFCFLSDRSKDLG